MNIVILSGGSGKRLWPLSNEIRSKQFLKLFRNGEGKYGSMIQRVYAQIIEAKLHAKIVVATSKGQVEILKNQLPESVELIVEPERRNTFPAIVLSAFYLRDKKGIAQDEPIIVVPVDPYVQTEYFHCLKALEKLAARADCDIALMGIKPTYPSSKYGYILSGQKGGYRTVEKFVEKPTEETAEKLIREGAYWNGGVFAFKAEYLLDIVKERYGIGSYDAAIQKYSELKKDSFDYEIVENAKNAMMVEYCGEWKDLGTWNTLTEEMSDSLIGKGILDEDCKNTNVINELDIPVVVKGVQDLVVAAAHDGILVCDKAASSYIKPIVDKIEMRPMYEERRWGEYKVIDYNQYKNGRKTVVKHVIMKDGSHSSYHLHNLRDEVWIIVNGQGMFRENDSERLVREGDTISIKKGTKHGIKTLSELHFIEIQIGSAIEDSDKEFFPWN